MKQYRNTPIYLSEDGKAFRDDKECTYQKTNKGYLVIRPMINGKRIYISLHRAIAETYIENVENKTQVNHMNGNKLDNSVSNLNWMTNKENREHALQNGLHVTGESTYNSILTNEDVLWIRQNYIPKHSQYGGIPLSKKYGTTPSRISKIVNYKQWKHI
jgi:hypothetical protein